MQNPFRPATQIERRSYQASKIDQIMATADELDAILGHTAPGSPDGKTDAEFYAITNQGEYLELWNWKDGGYLGRDFDEREMRAFSVWYSNAEALQQLRYWLAIHRKS